MAQAAAAIVDAEGHAALTLARLAGDLGVATPSLYKHVGGLDDLRSRVVAIALRRLTARLTAASLGRSGYPALSAMAAEYRSFARDHAGLYAAMQRASSSLPVDQGAEAAHAVEVIAAAIRGYGVADDLSVHAIRLVRSALHGFCDIEARGGFQMPHSLDESFLLLVDALDASLRHLGRAAQPDAKRRTIAPAAFPKSVMEGRADASPPGSRPTDRGSRRG